MDVRTILYVNIFLLAGCTLGLSVIAFHHKRFRQFLLLAIAYATGGLSTALRMQQGHIPDFFVLVLSNVMLIAALLLVHHCFMAFLKKGFRTGWLEAFFFIPTSIGLAYYTHIHPSYMARSLLMSLAFAGIAAMTAYVLIRYADDAVRIPCGATAALYVVFGIMTSIRCVGIIFWGLPQDYFVASSSQLIGFLGFYILIAGIPVGYFWMTSSRLYANQELLARTDSLTGLLNRRGMEDQSTREIGRSRREGTPLAVLAIDLDYFKNINDKYGHETGDTVLCSVAKALTSAMRGHDFAARLGGEEFIVVLSNTNRENAVITAERLRSSVAALSIPVRPYNLGFTASFGIAILHPGDTLEDALRRADHALYEAKLAGRNRIVLEPESLLKSLSSGSNELHSLH
ncbi:GGDEF domain-containing protein [Edaphobacter albus]|uniref:GGDEF domain-containing protein n=1 Tax=Edaphobacter sp. 4G125 TaxID=2763071 RepID=UPI0016470BF9|nr:diguanylate cyclase [Edaphobacter sp. 4G125]QNI36901.1 GGDEF domain-containing protein [Edaphobacter sp. 4G125]